MAFARHRRIITTEAAAFPVTLTEVKTHLRITGTADDTYLNDLISVATKKTEDTLSRALVSQTWDMYMDRFPGYDQAIQLPVPPTISIVHVNYFDSSDVEQTWDAANYTLDSDQSYQALLYPAINVSWPSVRNYPKAINIQFVAGYQDSGASPVDLADSIPMDIKQAILLLIGHLYENREATTLAVSLNMIPIGYMGLLANYQVREF